jgi:hypothetical protein
VLDEKTIEAVSRFIRDNGDRILEYYQEYEWGGDYYCNGFYRIKSLEEKVYKARESLKEETAREVVQWGVPRWATRFSLKGPVDLKNTKGVKDILERVEKGIKIGRGIAIVSKILRFLIPEDFAAIDTKLVKVFGKGAKNPWLKFHNNKTGTAINKSPTVWPSEYMIWLKILKYIAVNLEECGIYPTYPKQWESFIKKGFRKPKKWYAADVEMALWAYASEVIERSKKHKKQCR